MNELVTWDEARMGELTRIMEEVYGQIIEVGRPKRSLTARNYESALKGLAVYMHQTESGPIPTKTTLSAWRDTMLDAGLAVSTVNARLSAARKLLNEIADNTTDLTMKFILRDWANVQSAKDVVIQDKTEEDYGKRLTLTSLQKLFDSIPKTHVKGLRDRAIVALGAGAGLRVSEIVRLTVSDVFHTTNEAGQRGIRVRNSKQGKTRVVVLNGWNSWVLEAVQAYADCIGLDITTPAPDRIIRGVKRIRGGWVSVGSQLSTRQAQAIFEGKKGYLAEYAGKLVSISFHDLRRTYAKLSKQAGMSWDALRLQLGHSSIQVTEAYVGYDVDWTERIPNWRLVI